MKITNRDILILFLLFTFNLLYAYFYVDFSLMPFEDAAMIMRYAENFTHGHGIVWNIGEAPLDGATDFLVVVIIGLMGKIGLSPEIALRILTTSSHLIMIAGIYLINRSRNHLSMFFAAILAIYFLLNPGLYYVASYFATPFFAFLILLMSFLANEISSKTESHFPTKLAVLFVFLGIITGMTRPEGILFVGYLYLTLLIFSPSKAFFLRFLKLTLPLFLLLGGIYFLGRWSYFGYPLPNPFYRKGGFFLASGFFSFYTTAIFILPFLPLFIWAFFQKEQRKTFFFSVLPVLLFALSFVFLSNEMNFCGRFQYPLLAVLLISPIWKEIGVKIEDLKTKHGLMLWFYLLILCFFFPIHRYQSRGIYEKDGRNEVALFLQKFASKHYTIATTEAGILPYYSKWTAIDVWGLNDAWISHHKVISSEYLDRYKPEIVMIDNRTIEEQKKIYTQMLDSVRHYVQQNPYQLALQVRPLEAKDTFSHLYYVRKDCPLADTFINTLGKMDYCGWEKITQK